MMIAIFRIITRTPSGPVAPASNDRRMRPSSISRQMIVTALYPTSTRPRGFQK